MERQAEWYLNNALDLLGNYGILNSSSEVMSLEEVHQFETEPHDQSWFVGSAILISL